MERNKEIYFCIDSQSYIITSLKFKRTTCCQYYNNTEEAIKKKKDVIVTTSMAHFSFSLRGLGYKIYLCYKTKVIEIRPCMDLTGIGEPCKILREGNNILKLFKAGVFNQLLETK